MQTAGRSTGLCRTHAVGGQRIPFHCHLWARTRKCYSLFEGELLLWCCTILTRGRSLPSSSKSSRNNPTSSGLPAEAYNLVACASVDSGGLVSVWDIRSASPAASFTGHGNRSARCGVSFSPCMRFLAVGSEDRAGAAIYDLTGGGGRPPVGRCAESRNVKDGAVVAVAFNPLFPQLCTGSLGGGVKFYHDGGTGLGGGTAFG
jgi:WD40 repeat protein